MLTPSDEARLLGGFRVYEHYWRYPASYLGEPFLLEDILAFYDGVALNVPAFALGDVRRLALTDILDRLASLEQISAPNIIHIWGNAVLPFQMSLYGKNYRCVEKSKESYLGEFSIEIKDAGPFGKEAQKAIRSFARDGLEITICEAGRISWREMQLIELWRNRIEPGKAGTVAGASIADFMRSETSYIARCHRAGELLGFSVFAIPRDDIAINLMSFAERRKGLRIEDNMLFATINECRQRKIQRLHLGYAGNETLARFKHKWGGVKTGPDYSQAIYVSDSRYQKLINDFSFFWMTRLVESATGDIKTS